MSERKVQRRAAPVRFKAYLAGSVMFHLVAAAALIYGLYLLHPLCVALFFVGIGIETRRRRMSTQPFETTWQVPDPSSWQRTGDRLADLIIESGLFKPNAIKYENILRLLFEKENQQRQQQQKQQQTEMTREVLVYREIIKELEAVPAWVDWQKIERGRQVYKDHLVLICAGLSIALIEAYSFPIDAQVLYISGGLTASRKAAVRRLMETGYWIFTVMKEGVRVGSKGHAACVNVRLIHALARKLCLMSPEWSQSGLSDVDSDGKQLTEEEMKEKVKENGVDGLLMKFVKMAKREQGQNAGESADNRSGSGRTGERVEETTNTKNGRLPGELPINQATLLGTLFLFCHVCIEVAQLRGAKITQEEKESYWHLWRYIGHLIGIDDRVMPEKYVDGLSARLGALYQERQRPDYTSKLLATSTVDALGDLPSIPFNRPLFSVSIRKFLGDPLSDQLGLESMGRVTVAKWWMSKYCYVLCDTFNVVFPPLKRWQSALFWRFVDEVYREYFTIHLPPPSLGSSSPGSPSLTSRLAAPSAFCPFLSPPSSGTIPSKLVRCPFGG